MSPELSDLLYRLLPPLVVASITAFLTWRFEQTKPRFMLLAAGTIIVALALFVAPSVVPTRSTTPAAMPTGTSTQVPTAAAAVPAGSPTPTWTAGSSAISIPIRANDLDGYEDPAFHMSGDGIADDWVGTDTSVMTGLIFTSVSIPKGATVVSSYIRFRGFGTGGNAAARIRGFAEDSPAAFKADGTNKPSTRPTTTALVDWTSAWTYQWQWFQTPDLSSVVQEVVNRPGWAPGNSIGFQVSNPTGKGTNWAIVDYAGGPYNNLGGSDGSGHSVTLYVSYTMSPLSNRLFFTIKNGNAWGDFVDRNGNTISPEGDASNPHMSISLKRGERVLLDTDLPRFSLLMDCGPVSRKKHTPCDFTADTPASLPREIVLTGEYGTLWVSRPDNWYGSRGDYPPQRYPANPRLTVELWTN